MSWNKTKSLKFSKIQTHYFIISLEDLDQTYDIQTLFTILNTRTVEVQYSEVSGCMSFLPGRTKNCSYFYHKIKFETFCCELTLTHNAHLQATRFVQQNMGSCLRSVLVLTCPNNWLDRMLLTHAKINFQNDHLSKFFCAGWSLKPASSKFFFYVGPNSSSFIFLISNILQYIHLIPSTHHKAELTRHEYIAGRAASYFLQSNIRIPSVHHENIWQMFSVPLYRP